MRRTRWWGLWTLPRLLPRSRAQVRFAWVPCRQFERQAQLQRFVAKLNRRLQGLPATCIAQWCHCAACLRCILDDWYPCWQGAMLLLQHICRAAGPHSYGDVGRMSSQQVSSG
jgi:hypothetical protein